MRPSQKILQKRITEIEEVIGNFPQHSADYKKLKVIQDDLTMACNILAMIQGPEQLHRVLKWEVLEVLKNKIVPK